MFLTNPCKQTSAGLLPLARTRCCPRRPPYLPLETQETPPHQIALKILLTRVTRIFQKSVFTETTPAARAGDRAGFFVARSHAAAARSVFGATTERDKPCRLRRVRAEIRPAGRAAHAIGQRF